MERIPFRSGMTVPEVCIAFMGKDGIKHYDFYHPFGAVQKNERDTCASFVIASTAGMKTPG